MENLTHYPLLVLATAFVTLWLAYVTGSWLRRNNPSAGDEHNEDIGVILSSYLNAAGIDHRFQLLDGHQSLRPAQEF